MYKKYEIFLPIIGCAKSTIEFNGTEEEAIKYLELIIERYTNSLRDAEYKGIVDSLFVTYTDNIRAIQNNGDTLVFKKQAHIVEDNDGGR